MSKYIRTEGPLYFAAIVCALMFLDYYFVIPGLSNLVINLQKFAITTAGFAMVLGLFQYIVLHIRKIQRREKHDWLFSIWSLFTLVIVVLIGLSMGTNSSLYKQLYGIIYTPVSGAVYSLTGFFIISATIRSTRIRSIDVAFFMIPAIIIIAFNTPLIESFLPLINPLGTWFLNIINTAALRAFRIASAIGAVVFSLRIILLIEKRWIS